MLRKTSGLGRKSAIVSLGGLSLMLLASQVKATNYYWYPAGGTWNAINKYWRTDPLVSTSFLWTDTTGGKYNSAFFGSGGGNYKTVTLGGSINLHSMTFDTAGYTIKGSSALNFKDADSFITANADAIITASITGSIIKDGAGTLTIDVPGSLSPDLIKVAQGTLLLKKTSTSVPVKQLEVQTGATLLSAGTLNFTKVDSSLAVAGTLGATDTTTIIMVDQLSGGSFNLTVDGGTINTGGGNISLKTLDGNANLFLKGGSINTGGGTLFLDGGSKAAADASIVGTSTVTFQAGKGQSSISSNIILSDFKFQNNILREFNVEDDPTAAVDLFINGNISNSVGALENGTLPDNGINKTGLGTLAINGTCDYTGDTVVSAGTLKIDGEIKSSHVYVRNGATLGGIGNIKGEVTVDAGGHLAPGNSIHAQTVDALNISAVSILDFELGSLGNNDIVNVTGKLSLPASGTGTATLNIIDNNNADNLGSISNGTYTLFTYGSLENWNPVAFTFGQTPTGWDTAHKKYTLANDSTLKQITLSIDNLTSPLSLSLLHSNSAPASPGSRITSANATFSSPNDTLTVTGHDGYYLPASATNINNGAGLASGFIAITGFTPADDQHLIFLNLKNNGTAINPGTDAALINQIVSDLNAAYGSNVAFAMNPAGYDSAHLFPGYDLYLQFPTGPSNTGSQTWFAFDFSSYSATGISNLTLTDIAAIPEPFSFTLTSLCLLPLLARRRRK